MDAADGHCTNCASKFCWDYVEIQVSTLDILRRFTSMRIQRPKLQPLQIPMRSLFGVKRCFGVGGALSTSKSFVGSQGWKHWKWKGKTSLAFVPDLKTVLHQAKVFSFDIGQFPYTRGNSKLMKAHLQCTFLHVVSIVFCRGSVVLCLCSWPHLASICSLSVTLSGPLWVHLRTISRDCQSLWWSKAGPCHNVATA